MALLQQPVTRPGTGKPLRVAVQEALDKVRRSGKPIDPEMPLYLQDVRIFKDGTFKGETNNKEDIRKIIKTTLEVNKEIGFIPFSKIDHNSYEQYLANPWASLYPYALGDIDLKSLHEVDGYLISNFYIPYSVAGLIEKGRLRSVSVEIIPDAINPLNGKKYSSYLKAVALLGKDLEALHMVINQYNDTSTKTINLKYDKILCYQLGEPNKMNPIMTALEAIGNALGVKINANADPGQDPNQEPDGDEGNISEDASGEGQAEPDSDDTNDMDYLKQPDAVNPAPPPGISAQQPMGQPQGQPGLSEVTNLLRAIAAKFGIGTQPQAQQPQPSSPVPQAKPPFPQQNKGMAYSAKDIISEDKNEMSTPNPNPEQGQVFDQEALRKAIETEMELKYGAKNKALEAQVTQLSGVVVSLVGDKQLLTTKEFVYSLKEDKDGILLLPALEKDTIDYLSSLSPVKEKHFSAAGTEVEESQQDKAKAFITNFVKQYQPFIKAYSQGETGKVRLPNQGETGGNTGSRIVNADPDSELTHERILQYAAKNGLTLNSKDNEANAANYREAMKMVSLMENSN